MIKKLLPLILLMASTFAHGLEFTIEKRVKNGYKVLDSSQRPARSSSGRELKPGVQYAGPLYLSDQTLRYLKYQLKVIKEKLPIGFNKIKKIIIVPTVFPEKKGEPHTHAKYYTGSNKLEINHRYLFKGYEQLLLKSLVHEIAHAYEEEVQTVHIREKFLWLAGWHKTGLIFKWQSRRNFMNYRSPDPYEWTSTTEAFAVNMEYFLLDPQYQCRRPLLYGYLAQELMELPFMDEVECDQMLVFPESVGDKVVWWKMDPKKLYEVHYLLADKGSSAMSLFGHSMIRLVMCAPHRKEVNKECLKDIEYHKVLSYRANVTDSYINTWKGLVGGYASQMFVYPMVQIVNEYTRDEFRNLLSIPLNIGKFRMHYFIKKMQEEAWAYRGRYKFVTVNCATETLDFFKAFIDDMAFREQYSLTPRGVLDILLDYRLAYAEALFSKDVEWKRQRTYLFESKEAAYNRFYLPIRSLDKHGKLDKYLANSKAETRNQIIDQLLNKNAESEVYSGMYILEKFILVLRQRNLQNAIVKYAETADGAKELRDLIGNKLDFLRNQMPKEKLGYGIPNQQEFEQIRDYINLKTQITGIDPKKIASMIEHKFSKELEEMKNTERNIKRLKALVLAGED